MDPAGSLRFQNLCGCERSSCSYGYRRFSSINARYMARNIGLTVTASEGVCFRVPGRPALGANKQLNPIDCSNAASAPSATRRRSREKQHSAPESKQIILKRPPHPTPTRNKKAAESKSRVDVGASSKRGTLFCFFTRRPNSPGTARCGARQEESAPSARVRTPSSPVPPRHRRRFFETRSLTHSRSTAFKYFKRAGCGAIT